MTKRKKTFKLGGFPRQEFEAEETTTASDKYAGDVSVLRPSVGMPDNQDAFGKLIADNTTNNLDIASHYSYNPERWRLRVDESRRFPEYNSVNEYNHAVDVHELMPSGSQTIVFQTAERPRYVVQYELVSSFAWQLNQDLQNNDRIRIGLYDGIDGWFVEQSGSHSTGSADICVMRSGSVKSRETVNLSKPFTHWCRYALHTNWYNAGNQRWIQTYTSDGIQYNDELGRTSIDDGTRGPQVGNLPLRYEVRADQNTSGLKLEAGSVAHSTLGDTNSRIRQKITEISGSVSTANTWIPVYAFRKKTDKSSGITNVQLKDVAVVDIDSDTADLKVLSISSDPSHTNASGFDTPPEWSRQNSTVESTLNITTYPSASGEIVSQSQNPGGFQLGLSGFYSTGKDSKGGKLSTVQGVKRPVYDDDVMVVLVNSDTVDVGFKIFVTFEQDW